jgi:hypothetical protein
VKVDGFSGKFSGGSFEFSGCMTKSISVTSGKGANV